MSVLGLHHINIRTPDYKLTLEFLRNALGMKVTAVPGHGKVEKAAWSHDETGALVLHLASSDTPYSPAEILPSPPPRGSGAIHHIALTCTNFEAMRARLVALELEFRESAPEPGIRQIFVQDPSGITFELNFDGG